MGWGVGGLSVKTLLKGTIFFFKLPLQYYFSSFSLEKKCTHQHKMFFVYQALPACVLFLCNVWFCVVKFNISDETECVPANLLQGGCFLAARQSVRSSLLFGPLPAPQSEYVGFQGSFLVCCAMCFSPPLPYGKCP